MNRPTMEKELKNAFLELPRIDGGYTIEQISALRDMAEKDVYPDGRFSDEECNLWSMFHMFVMRKA